ncbi:T9SS type A sorting domain-containing protein, partial [bacterium]|nr:T9SS type A sorting domain-containing protein [bacterium]
DSGDFNSGCGDERSGFENVVISDSEFGISIEGNVAPELSNVAFQDITDDRDIYLATGDVVVPVDFEWNLIAPTHVVASSTSTVVDYDYGVEDKFDLIVEGLLNTNRDDPGDSTWVFFEPEDPSDATATEWGGVFLNWSSSGSVVKYADFSYAENPLYLDWPGWNGSTVSATYIRNCRVHHFADVGIWVHGSLGNSAGGAVVESSLVERGSTLIPALGRVGVYLDGADLGGLSDNTIRIESNSLGDPAADYSHAVEAYFGKPMCLAAGPYWARTLSFLGNTLEGPDHDADATVGGTSGFFGNYLCGGNNRTIEVKENWIHGFNFSGLDFNRSSDVQVECNVVDDNARAIEFTRDIATTGVGVRFKENYFGVPADHESLVQTDMAAKTKLGAAITSTKGLNEFRTYGTEGNDLTRFILENEPGDTDSLDARKNQWWKNDTLFTNVDSVYVEALIWTTLPTDTIPENEPAVRLDPLVEQIQDPCWEDVAGRQARRPGLVGGSRVVDAGGTKGVEDLAESVPLVTRISAPYPNPAHGSSRVALEISPDRAGRYRIEVFDVAGRSVAVLMDRDVSAGRYQVEWPGRVHGGRTAGPGVYFVRVTGPGVHRNAKLVVLR